MKSIKLIFILPFIWLMSCNDQPIKLSGERKTIEVSYVNWACDCADFIETKFFKNNSGYETREEDCIFIEPSNIENKIPAAYYDEAHFKYYLRLNGQFYKDQGVPDSYERKTPERPKKASVFRYETYELIRK